MSGLLCEYTFVPSSADGADRGKLADAVVALFATLRRNGQVWDRELSGWVDGALRVMCHVPARSALSEQHHSLWVRAELKRTVALCAEPPSWRVVDERAEAIEEHWQDSTGLYLFTHLLDHTSPVCSGRTGQPVPLYLLPVQQQLRLDLVWWMQTYRTYDELQLGAGKLEMAAYAELAAPNSELSARGRALARQVETATGLPTYYYLLRYWGRREGEERRPCPGCGGDWLASRGASEQGLGWFEFRCETCRLVSHVAGTFDDESHAAIGEWQAAKAG